MESTKISSPQGPQAAHGARPRSTANAQDAGEAAGGGFMALLAALGSTDAAVGDPLLETATEADAATQGAANDAQDASFLAAWQGLFSPGAEARADASALGSQAGAVPSGTGTGADALTGSGGLGMGAADGAAWGPQAMLAAGAGVQGIVAETAMLDAAAGNRNGAPLAGSAAHGKALSRLQSTAAQKADAADALGGRMQPGAATQALGGHSGIAAGTGLTNAAERLAGGAVTGVPDRGAGGPAQAVAGSLAAALTEAVSSMAQASGGGGGTDARSRPGEGRSEGAAGFGDMGVAAPAEGGSVDGAAVFADPTQAALEDQVAEQVAFWVNQKTQNAELTLDRDGQPVEVSVTLSGNEAHVAFRSDQSATREMLDKSMAQLSELLRSEGLVLSGMSVGTSSSQREHTDDSARPGRREGTRQARVEVAAPAGTGPLLRSGSPDRALDVFV